MKEIKKRNPKKPIRLAKYGLNKIAEGLSSINSDETRKEFARQQVDPVIDTNANKIARKTGSAVSKYKQSVDKALEDPGPKKSK